MKKEGHEKEGHKYEYVNKKGENAVGEMQDGLVVSGRRRQYASTGSRRDSRLLELLDVERWP